MKTANLSPKNCKPPLNKFLSQNPFSSPWTLGFFYREKMRAIHQIAPDIYFPNILEIGGGQGGLTALLYPQSQVTNLDLDARFAEAPCNQNPQVKFICGDATDLPFEDHTFDAVTLFDVLEHIPNDAKAISEALRVLRPGGYLLLSTPNEHWQFPYYKLMTSICPAENEVMAEWGHVRRGYTAKELDALLGFPHEDHATFITPVTAIGHDIAFSNLPWVLKQGLSTLVSPITLAGYFLHQPHTKGTETAYRWEKPSRFKQSSQHP